MSRKRWQPERLHVIAQQKRLRPVRLRPVTPPPPVLLAASGFSFGPAGILLRDRFPFALEYGAKGQRCCSILCSQAGAATLANFHAPRTPPGTARTRPLSNNLQTSGSSSGRERGAEGQGRATITCYLAHASNLASQGVPMWVILVYGRGTHKRSMDSAIRRICL